MSASCARARSVAGKDLDDLFCRLAGTEDSLRKPPADLAMVIDTGKSQIFKGHMAEGFETFFDTHGPSFNRLQQLF